MKNLTTNIFDPAMRHALNGSIAKWRGIVKGELYDEGPDNCPLCQLYLYTTDCEGCPIAADVQAKWCEKTPYGKVKADTTDKQMRKIAKKELAYLIKLRAKLDKRRQRALKKNSV